MSKNLIPQIAEMLGVALGEEFKVKGDDYELTYIFTDDGLKITYAGGIEISQVSTNSAFVALVMGEDEIVKLPWKPKKGEDYYTFGGSDGSWRVSQQHWTCHPFDLALFEKGWVYRTRAEAEAALHAVAAEMGVKHVLKKKKEHLNA